MRKRKVLKQAVALTLALGISLSGSLTAFAGEWKKDAEYGVLWWYERDDKTYPVDCWEQIDGKSYHFDFEGYLETNVITSDGYHVDENGAWIESIPQMSQEEMDKYYHDLFYNTLSDAYKGGVYADEAEFEEEVHLYFANPVEAEQVINEIRSNHTFVPSIF